MTIPRPPREQKTNLTRAVNFDIKNIACQNIDFYKPMVADLTPDIT